MLDNSEGADRTANLLEAKSQQLNERKTSADSACCSGIGNCTYSNAVPRIAIKADVGGGEVEKQAAKARGRA